MAYTRKRTLRYYISEVITMSVKDAVAKRFIELLKERDMNVNQLAIISGVTASTVYSLSLIHILSAY